MTGAPTEPVRLMQQVISLDYRQIRPPVSREFGRALVEGRVIGHQCPRCGLAYVPPNAYGGAAQYFAMWILRDTKP